VDLRTMTPKERYDLQEAVLDFAQKITRSREAAEELTQEALLRLMTTRPWNPLGKTSLERHVCGIVKSLLWAERMSKRPAVERRAMTEHALLAEGGDSAEAISLDRAERERKEALGAQRVGKLRAKLKGYVLELLILDLMQNEGIRKPAALADRTGRPVGEVNDALERIRRYMKSIIAGEGGDRGEDEEVAQ
jgi:DNA-directed RNA polymerase specialized sigma24 family protein